MRRLTTVLCLVGILGIFLFGGTAFSQRPTGELVICQGADINSLDIVKHISVQDLNYSHQVYDMLYLRDVKGVPQPRLATSHKIINDTTWEFKLRKDVKFHDGTPMTAKDVKFSIDREIDPQNKVFFAQIYATIKEAQVVDDYTIRVITKAPDPLLLKRLSHNMFILPSDQVKQKGADVFFQHPIGTGPFKFVSWTRNDRMVLEANESYWGGAPKVKRVILRPVPEIATRLAELQTGNADIITNVPPFLVDKVKESPKTTVYSVPSGRVMFVYINTLAEGPLKNKKVRQALNYAVDRNSIINNVLKGSGIPVATAITAYHHGYDPSLKPYPYDPEKAKKLLAEAGVSGLKVSLSTPSGRYILDKEVAEAIAGMLRTVGVEADLNVVEFGTYVQILTSKKLDGLGFQGWGNPLHDADGTFSLLFLPESPFSYYGNPAVSEKIIKARSSMDDKKRMALYKEIQRDLFDDAPFIFLYQQVDHWGVSKAVKGFEARGDEQFLLYNVSK